MKILIQCTIIALLVLSGCLQDEGNYEYLELDKIAEITGIDKMYSVSKHSDTLRIFPEISYTLGNEDDYEFEWSVNYPVFNEETSSVKNVKVIISDEKNLEYVADHQVPYDDLFGIYKVSNKSTGVSYTKDFTLRVANAYEYGYFFMCEEEDNTTELFLVRDNWKTIDNLYELIAGHELKGKPYEMEQFRNSGKQELVMFTSDPDSIGAVMAFNDLAYKWSAINCFHERNIGIDPIVVDWFKYEESSGNMHTIINGDYHYTNRNQSGEYKPYIGMEIPDLEEKVDRTDEICWGLEYIHGTNPGTIYVPGTLGSVSSMTIDDEPYTIPGECFFMAGEPGKYAFYGINTYLFVRENGVMKEVVINASGFSSLNYTVVAEREFVGSDLITDETKFISSYSQRYFYFSSGNKVYRYNYDAPADAPTVFIELPEGQSISYLFMDYDVSGWSNVDAQFIIGSYDDSGANNGSIYFVNLDGSIDKSYEHVCGKVVDMEFKK